MSEKILITECFSPVDLPNILFRSYIFTAPTTFHRLTMDVDQEEGDDNDDGDDDDDDADEYDDDEEDDDDQ